MSKSEKFVISMILVIIVFLIGMFIGEKKVLNEQKISANESGYSVEFDGHEYLYN